MNKAMLVAVAALTVVFVGAAQVNAYGQWCGGGGSSGGGGGGSSGGGGGGGTPSGGGGGGTPSGGGGGSGGGMSFSGGGEATPKTIESITMRYFLSTEMTPGVLKETLKKVKGVEAVELMKSDRTARVSWSGKCKDLASLESAASSCGVPAIIINHAHVYIAFKPLKGANLETLQKGLQAMKGVKGARVSGTAAELHADLDVLTIEEIRGAAKDANFEAQLKSHQWVSTDVKNGDSARVEKEIGQVYGVLVVRSGGASINFWALKAVTDGMLTRAAEKVGAALADILKP